MKSGTIPSRTVWHTGGLLILFVSLVATEAAPPTRSISGVVETVGGKPLAHVEVRVTNVGGMVSTDSGEFTIPLKSGFEAGDPLELTVRGWIITSPWEGRSFVPKRDTDMVHVFVARPGDTQLLGNPQVVQQIVRGVTHQLGKPTQLASPDAFMAGKAKELGFTLDQLKSAIDDWTSKVHEPYQKGLAALYKLHYKEAGQYIQQSISASESDLVEKYASLARAEFEQGHYSSAETALMKARGIQGESATVLDNLGNVLWAEARYTEAEPLFKRAITIDEKALGTERADMATHLNNLAQLDQLPGSKLKSPVRITGQQLFDASHHPCKNGRGPKPQRISIWEFMACTRHWSPAEQQTIPYGGRQINGFRQPRVDSFDKTWVRASNKLRRKMPVGVCVAALFATVTPAILAH